MLTNQIITNLSCDIKFFEGSDNFCSFEINAINAIGHTFKFQKEHNLIIILYIPISNNITTLHLTKT